MKTFKFLILATLGIGLLHNINAQEIGISTGSTAGTYYPIAQDIVSVCSPIMNIKAHTAKGSIENIERILKLPKYQYAIVQHDALSWYEKNIDKALRNKIKFIFPLYNEEVHILVNKKANIKRISDLRGKRVNIGREKSGSWVTARLIRQLVGLYWRESYDNPKSALIKLLRNEIDAMIYVVGKPAKIFEEDLPADAGDYIELLPCSHPNLDDVYVKTQIEKGTYTWHNKTIDAYTTKAILVTYNYQCNHQLERFRKAAENICHLINQVNQNLASLKANNHPKWKEINPNLSSINWPVHIQAQKAFNGGDYCSCTGGRIQPIDPTSSSKTTTCTICELRHAKAAEAETNQDYCSALKTYNKIATDCRSCPTISIPEIKRRITNCQLKCRQ